MVGCRDTSEPVQRLPKRVYDSSQQCLADRDFDDASGLLDCISLLDALIVSHDYGTDAVLFEIQRHAHDAARKLQQLSHFAVGQTIDARDPVSHLKNDAFVADSDLSFEALQFLLKNGCDLFGSYCHRCCFLLW